LGPGRKTGAIPGFGFDQLKPRESRSRADELQYFMVSTSCVRCRRTVQAPVDKLHYKLRCPHCGTLMHLREDGKWYEGVHPSLQRGGMPTRWAVMRKAIARHPWLQRRATLAAAGLLILGIAAWGLMHVLAQRHAGPPPATLTDRAAWVCEAVLTDDTSRLGAVTSRPSRRPAADWLEQIRSRLSASRAKHGHTTEVSLEVLFENWPEGRAGTSAHFVAADGDGVRCVLFWVLDDERYWVLDGERTLSDLETGGGR
jgi:DNA-directed RNA polymerase subunit RPC12/RpoP